MSEGFVVVSRWGPRLHAVGCPCGVCISRRKHQNVNKVKQKAAEQDANVPSSAVLTPRQSNSGSPGAPGADASIDATVNAHLLQSETQQGLTQASTLLTQDSKASVPAAIVTSVSAQLPVDSKTSADKAAPKVCCKTTHRL